MLEARVAELKTELERKKHEVGRMMVLREALKLAKEMKEFAEQVFEPLVRKCRIPLHLTDEDFERLKGNKLDDVPECSTTNLPALFFHFTVVLESLKSTIVESEDQQLFDQTLDEIAKLGLEDNFVSIMSDEKKLLEDTKKLVDELDKSAKEMAQLKADIEKIETTLKKFAEENAAKAKGV